MITPHLVIEWLATLSFIFRSTCPRDCAEILRAFRPPLQANTEAVLKISQAKVILDTSFQFTANNEPRSDKSVVKKKTNKQARGLMWVM
jgi:hypothetical protein